MALYVGLMLVLNSSGVCSLLCQPSLPSSSLGPPQLARISQLHGLLVPNQPLDYLSNLPEPRLEGVAPTLDLSLFREAQSRMRQTLVCVCVRTHK